MSDEIFGPLSPIFRYKTTSEVVNFIRARPKPLGMYCFTTDDKVAQEMLTRTSSGGAIINDVVVHLSNSELPFGGVGNSGMGSYHGKRSFDSFSHHKVCQIQLFMLLIYLPCHKLCFLFNQMSNSQCISSCLKRPGGVETHLFWRCSCSLPTIRQ
jgi:hypothetical protein